MILEEVAQRITATEAVQHGLSQALQTQQRRTDKTEIDLVTTAAGFQPLRERQRRPSV